MVLVRIVSYSAIFEQESEESSQLQSSLSSKPLIPKSDTSLYVDRSTYFCVLPELLLPAQNWLLESWTSEPNEKITWMRDLGLTSGKHPVLNGHAR